MTENNCSCREKERELHFNEAKCSFVWQSDTQGNLIDNKISMKDALLSIYKTDQLII